MSSSRSTSTSLISGEKGKVMESSKGSVKLAHASGYVVLVCSYTIYVFFFRKTNESSYFKIDNFVLQLGLVLCLSSLLPRIQWVSKFKLLFFKKFFSIIDKSGRYRQVLVNFRTRFRWSLVVVDRWSLFRGCFSTKFAWAGYRVVVVQRWSLTQVWLYLQWGSCSTGR